MASLNKTELIGYVGANPEMRYFPDGTATTTISVATTEKWKDRESGEAREHTEWHRVMFAAKLAEIVGEYVRKGALLYVEGRLRTRKWTDKDDVDRYTTEIVANEMQMLDRADRKAGSGQRASVPVPAGDDFDDDLPY